MDCKRKIRRALAVETLFFAGLFALAFHESRKAAQSLGAAEDVYTENCLFAELETGTGKNNGNASEPEPEEKNGNASETGTGSAVKKDFIKWVDFSVANEALQAAMEIDIETCSETKHIPWTSLLAYEATKTGGKITKKQVSDIKKTAEKLKNGELSLENFEKENKYYSYYKEVYEAVLGGLLGEYEKQTADLTWEKTYGLKGFHPIAKGFSYSDYDDFGVSRSYGYKRRHLGHDMMGLTGTPIVAVESGYVEALGWNQYGGWRVGIRSFDKKRYYYYAHLRQNFPFAEGLAEGSVVTAGDVIGYMGHTGYSSKENVNNINQTHLHFGIQIIFDESQKEGNSEIWIDCYQLVRFLYQHQQQTAKVGETKEWKRMTLIKDPAVEAYTKEKNKK